MFALPVTLCAIAPLLRFCEATPRNPRRHFYPLTLKEELVRDSPLFPLSPPLPPVLPLFFLLCVSLCPFFSQPYVFEPFLLRCSSTVNPLSMGKGEGGGSLGVRAIALLGCTCSHSGYVHASVSSMHLVSSFPIPCICGNGLPPPPHFAYVRRRRSNDSSSLRRSSSGSWRAPCPLPSQPPSPPTPPCPPKPNGPARVHPLPRHQRAVAW
jgi:hypothetical protein